MLVHIITTIKNHFRQHPIQRSKKNLKTKISRINNPLSSVFLYKNRGERDRERNKKERREKK
jgi:hypothetical protein